MKFTIAAFALTLGAQVFAAPLQKKDTDVVMTVNGVKSEVFTIPSKVSTPVDSTPKRDLDGDVAKDVVPTVSNPTSGLIGRGDAVEGVKNLALTPVTDTVSSLTKKGDSPVEVIVAAVSKLESTVMSELQTIGSVVEEDVTTSMVPQVEGSLFNIAKAINDTINTIVPAVMGAALNLASDEAEAVLSALGQVQGMVSEIQSTLETTVGSVEADAMKMLAPEISQVMNMVGPLVAPITEFASNAAGTLTGDEGTASQIISTASGVTAIANGIVSPVGTLVNAVAPVCAGCNLNPALGA